MDNDDDVYCTVGGVSHCNTDFSDIRFTDDNGSTELHYWMESKIDSDQAVFWVEIADDLSSVNQTIYVYYGKVDATTTSDITTTFIFGHDFRIQQNTTGWTVFGTPTITYDSVDGIKITKTGINQSGLRSNSTYAFSVIRNILSAFKFDVAGYNYPLNEICPTSTTSPDDAPNRVSEVEEATQDRLLKLVGNVYTSLKVVSSKDPTVFQKFNLRFKAGAVGFLSWKVDDVEQYLNATEALFATTANYLYIVNCSGTGTRTLSQKYIAIAKYVTPEPAHGAWGSEEETHLFLNEALSTLGIITNPLRSWWNELLNISLPSMLGTFGIFTSNRSDNGTLGFYSGSITTCNTTGVIYSISGLFEIGSWANITFGIYSYPSKILIAKTETKYVNIVPAATLTITCTFPNPPRVVSGSQYILMVEHTSNLSVYIWQLTQNSNVRWAGVGSMPQTLGAADNYHYNRFYASVVDGPFKLNTGKSLSGDHLQFFDTVGFRKFLYFPELFHSVDFRSFKLTKSAFLQTLTFGPTLIFTIRKPLGEIRSFLHSLLLKVEKVLGEPFKEVREGEG